MYKVLIVEDDPMVAMINEQYVRKNKAFSVIGNCRNGQEALDFLDQNSVDLVIMDIFMPYMDGVETLKKIREKKYPVEVIMVTAANDTTSLEDTMHLGVIDFLIKPFAYERFQIALEKFAKKRATLKETKVLDQNCIDSIITNSGKLGDKDFPKGIQEKTLQIIRQTLNSKNTWISGDTLSENIGLSSVTIRRYMNYLVSLNEAVETINYETGGRPCMLYKKAD